jgi:hypothetical protein
LIPNALYHSSNAGTMKNITKAQNKHATMVFSLDELKTMQKRKDYGTRKRNLML